MCHKAVGAGGGEENLADFVWMGRFLLVPEIPLHGPSSGRGSGGWSSAISTKVTLTFLPQRPCSSRSMYPSWQRRDSHIQQIHTVNKSKLQNRKIFILSAYFFSETKEKRIASSSFHIPFIFYPFHPFFPLWHMLLPHTLHNIPFSCSDPTNHVLAAPCHTLLFPSKIIHTLIPPTSLCHSTLWLHQVNTDPSPGSQRAGLLENWEEQDISVYACMGWWGGNKGSYNVSVLVSKISNKKRLLQLVFLILFSFLSCFL